jgi:hypothetical protein
LSWCGTNRRTNHSQRLGTKPVKGFSCDHWTANKSGKNYAIKWEQDLTDFRCSDSVPLAQVGPTLRCALEGALKHGTNLQFGRSFCRGFRPGGALQPTSNGRSGGLHLNQCVPKKSPTGNSYKTHVGKGNDSKFLSAINGPVVTAKRRTKLSRFTIAFMRKAILGIQTQGFLSAFVMIAINRGKSLNRMLAGHWDSCLHSRAFHNFNCSRTHWLRRSYEHEWLLQIVLLNRGFNHLARNE